MYYWANPSKSVWVLDEIGKTKPITCGVNDKIFHNEEFITRTRSFITGAITFGDSVLLSTQNEILEPTHQGGLISGSTTDYYIEAMGTLLEIPVYRTHNGKVISIPKNNEISQEIESIAWVEPTVPPSELVENVVNVIRRQTITLDKFILDLHSGLVFGNAGRILFDVIAIALCVLALTGFWMWLPNVKTLTSG